MTSRVITMVTFMVLVTPSHQRGYHANVIIRESLCTIPNNNGPLSRCEMTSVKGKEYNQIDCNQDQCRCSYKAASFTQACVYNDSHSYRRRCVGYEKNCTLYNDVKTGAATCEERYEECTITSEALPSRLAVGYPQYNPPVCYPGVKAAYSGCNQTSTSCEGLVQISFANTESSRLESCESWCREEQTTCTNYTKTCTSPATTWDRDYRASLVAETCDVITNKCIEMREMKWLPPNPKAEVQQAKHNLPKGHDTILVSHNCSVRRNLTEAQDFCEESIIENMKYKVECQLYAVKLTNYFFDSVFKANTSINTVTNYLLSHWDNISKMCKIDCFVTITRELRFCVNDLPIQNILPGITHQQLNFLMYRAEDLLCASVKESKAEESCILYLDQKSDIYNTVVSNITSECGQEISELEQTGRMRSCRESCRDHILEMTLHRHNKPGCCLADLMKFKDKSLPWMELMSPDVFKRNALLQLATVCDIKEEITSCTESNMMHPAVIFVIAVISVFSVAITVGVVTFIVIFYRQMEYEGYKKGFLGNIMKN